MATKFSWLLSGPLENSVINHNLVNSILIISGYYNQASAASRNEPLVDAVKQFCTVESTGICEKAHQPSYPVIEHIRYDNQHYEVGLPWR